MDSIVNMGKRKLRPGILLKYKLKIVQRKIMECVVKTSLPHLSSELNTDGREIHSVFTEIGVSKTTLQF